MTGVIYARYSSSGQREESIEGQLRVCYEYAKNNNITVIGEYIDKALTGKNDNRPDFQRMLRDCEKGRFDCVIMWKMDRFARNRYDSAIYKYRLKKNQIKLCYAMETIPDGPEGIILESVMEGYAEYYSENLSQNVKRGNYESALKLQTLGVTVLGLRKALDGRFEIDPETAPLVRRIFEEYAAGISAKEIYTRLNEEGYKTSRGGLFNKNSIRRILQNKKYIGVYEYDDIYIQDGIPPIIEKELFERVQNMVKLHHKSPALKRTEGGFLLTTKLFCGLCGEPMTGDGGTGKNGNVYNYYICNNRRKHTCEKERAPKDWIESLVVKELANLVCDDNFVEKVADKVIEFQDREKDNSAMKALENRKKQTQKAIDNLLKAIEDGIYTPTTKNRLLELEAERNKIEVGISREMFKEPKFSKSDIIRFLKKFRDGDIKNEQYKLSLVDTLLNSVYLYEDKLVLAINYSGDDNKITLPIIDSVITGAADSVKNCSKFAPSGTPTCPHNFYN